MFGAVVSTSAPEEMHTMSRFTKGSLALLSLVGFLASAGAALSADMKVECSVTKDGKATTQMVATKEECTKLGGKIVEPVSAKPKAQ